jgi:hypothetical protein
MTMRLRFEDHAAFQRGTLHVAVACSALAGLAALVGSEVLRPTAVVLGAAVATLALALGHARVVFDPVAEALARAADGADDEARALLSRTARARGTIARGATRTEGRGPGGARALAESAQTAATAIAALALRRGELGRALEAATPADLRPQLAALAERRASARDDLARESYARAESALAERATRGDAIARVVERIDARLAAAVAELEGAAFALATRSEDGAHGPPAALAAACERLRGAGIELTAEAEALAEVGAL